MADLQKRKKRRPGASVQVKQPTPSGGRVTPKGTTPAGGRYTPPIPREVKVGARWVPWAMGILFIGGMLMIVTNYLGVLPGGEASNLYLMGGLGLITAGFIVSTRWR